MWFKKTSTVITGHKENDKTVKEKKTTPTAWIAAKVVKMRNRCHLDFRKCGTNRCYGEISIIRSRKLVKLRIALEEGKKLGWCLLVVSLFHFLALCVTCAIDRQTSAEDKWPHCDGIWVGVIKCNAEDFPDRKNSSKNLRKAVWPVSEVKWRRSFRTISKVIK